MKLMKTLTMGCCAALICAALTPFTQVKLADAASPLPFIGLLVFLSLGGAMALRMAERPCRVGRFGRVLLAFLLCVALSLFITPAVLMAQSPAPVNLGTDVICTAPNTPVGCGVGSAAGDYVVLSGAAITDVPSSVITGNIGASPITGAAITVACTEVTGSIFEVDAG